MTNTACQWQPGTEAADAMTVEDLNGMLTSVFVLDVREPDEWATGHLDVANHIPLGQLQARANELPKDKHIVITCRSGGRSAKACELLKAQGFSAVTNLTGGMRAWSERIDPTLVVK